MGIKSSVSKSKAEILIRSKGNEELISKEQSIVNRDQSIRCRAIGSPFFCQIPITPSTIQETQENSMLSHHPNHLSSKGADVAGVLSSRTSIIEGSAVPPFSAMLIGRMSPRRFADSAMLEGAG